MKDFLLNIGFDPTLYENNKNVFDQAITHRSASHYKSQVTSHNERLEFLGDAVLELIVTEYLFLNFPEDAEGILTNYRSALVKKEHLATVAKTLKMGEHLILSKGEDLSGGRKKDYLLANLVEAFIGALFCSGGMEPAKKFVREHITSNLESIIKSNSHIDAKSALQEFTQGTLGLTPRYQVIKEEGKDHEKVFEMGVYLEEQSLGTGVGGSKKEAEINAAQAALEIQEIWEKEFRKKS